MWIYEVGNELAEDYDLTVFAKRVRGIPDSQSFASVDYRRVPPGPRPGSPMDRLTALLVNSKPVPQFAQPSFYYRYKKNIVEAIASDNFDVVHIHNLITLPSMLRATSISSKIVLHMHCEWLSQVPKDVALECVGSTNRVAACSEYLAAKIDGYLGGVRGECVTLANGVDTNVFRPDDRNGREHLGRREILFVGRISPEKAIHDLIDAFKIVHKTFPQTVLRIVGPYSPTPFEFLANSSDDPTVQDLSRWYEGNYLRLLKERAGDLLGQSILFEGSVRHSQLPDLYRSADVLANPSISESFGMSLIEAFACGTPVVATRIGGMREVLADGQTGIFVEAGDTDGLADALARLVSHTEVREAMSANARQVAVEKYSWNRIALETSRLYVMLGGST